MLGAECRLDMEQEALTGDSLAATTERLGLGEVATCIQTLVCSSEDGRLNAFRAPCSSDI